MQAEEEEADEGEQQQKRKRIHHGRGELVGFNATSKRSRNAQAWRSQAAGQIHPALPSRPRTERFPSTSVFPHLLTHTYKSLAQTYLHVHTRTHKYLQVLNALARTYKYLQVLTRTYTYLQVLTSTYTYLQVLAHMYNLLAVRCLPARSLPMPRQRGDHTSALAHDTPTASPSFRSRFQNGLRNVSRSAF